MCAKPPWPGTYPLCRFGGPTSPPSPFGCRIGCGSTISVPAETPVRPHSCHVLLGFLLSSQPFRQKLLNFPAMPSHQPLQVQHARPILVLVPRRPEPPVHLPGLLQLELGQP